MEKTPPQIHQKETFLYAFARMLERASYYGLRSLIVLYMTSETLKMESKEALSIYGWLAILIIVSGIIGALIGDLLIGNKRSILIGGLIQAIGAFSLCVPSTTGLYIGLGLVALGSGLYTPNIISNFGKLYLNKTKLLDAGFTLFYLAVNLGALFGTILIAYAGEAYGWNIGFILAGALTLLSLIPILISREKSPAETVATKLPINRRIIHIATAFVLIGFFWVIYEIANIGIFDLQDKLSEFPIFGQYIMPKSLWSTLNATFILPISFFAIILWTFLYSSQFFKLMIGFIFGALSFGMFFLIPEMPNEQHAMLYLIALLFLSISEIHIGPILHSILTQYANPKYLAILISLAFIPTKLFILLVGLFTEGLYENPSLALLIGLIAMTILSIGLIIYNQLNKKI